MQHKVMGESGKKAKEHLIKIDVPDVVYLDEVGDWSLFMCRESGNCLLVGTGDYDSDGPQLIAINGSEGQDIAEMFAREFVGISVIQLVTEKVTHGRWTHAFGCPADWGDQCDCGAPLNA